MLAKEKFERALDLQLVGGSWGPMMMPTHCLDRTDTKLIRLYDRLFDQHSSRVLSTGNLDTLTLYPNPYFINTHQKQPHMPPKKLKTKKKNLKMKKTHLKDLRGRMIAVRFGRVEKRYNWQLGCSKSQPGCPKAPGRIYGVAGCFPSVSEG